MLCMKKLRFREMTCSRSPSYQECSQDLNPNPFEFRVYFLQLSHSDSILRDCPIEGGVLAMLPEELVALVRWKTVSSLFMTGHFGNLNCTVCCTVLY